MKAEKFNKIILSIPLFFIFFPYFGIGFLPSDTQPFAVMFSIIALFLMYKPFEKIKIPYWVFPFLIMFILASISFFIQIFDPNNFKSKINLMRVLFAYFTPIPVTIYIYCYLKKFTEFGLLNKIIGFILFFTYFGFLLNILGFNIVISTFVNRAVPGGLFSSARGLISFYPEQSRISEQMAILFYVYLLVGKINIKRVLLLFLAGLLSFAGQFFIVLFQILISFFVAKLLTYILNFKINSKVNLKKIFAFISLIIFSGIFFVYIEEILLYLLNLGFPSRGINAVLKIINEGFHGLANDVGVLIKVSGVLLSLTTIIANPISFEILNINSLDSNFIDTYSKIQYFIFNNSNPHIGGRVYSALGTWIVNFGIIGFLMTILVVFSLWRKIFSLKPKYRFNYLWGVSFLSIILFLKLPLANPSLWGLVGIIYYYQIKY